MTTFGNAQGKIRTVMMRSGRDFSCQDKPLMDINRSMLLQAKVSDVILNRPVRFPVAGKFQWLSIFINFAFRRFTLVFFFFQSFIAELGRSRLNQLTDDCETGCKWNDPEKTGQKRVPENS